MKLNLVLLLVALTSSGAWADEFTPYKTASWRQSGALRLTDGSVNLNEAVEVRSVDGKRKLFAMGTRAKNFNDAYAECSELGSGWTLPTFFDTYFMGFLGIYIDRTGYEINYSGQKMLAFWFMEQEGDYTKAGLVGTDKFIVFSEGSSGEPRVQSLAETLESLAIDKINPKELTPALASKVILREKLSRGIYVVCVKGDSFM